MIIGNFIEVMPHCSKKNKLYTPQVGRLNGIDYIGLQLENKLYHAPWGKIIRRDCFNDDIFTTPRDIFRGEDLNEYQIRTKYRRYKNRQYDRIPLHDQSIFLHAKPQTNT